MCENYLDSGAYQVMAALDGDRVAGFAAITESCSLYAEGRFGIVQELYVLPEYRSQAVGKSLLEAVVALGRQQGWRRLELCTPPVPEFERTVSFYQANGFEITGGYKMKYMIS
nr:GNAT family N-acetyltransferase [Oceanobacter mangrovi]